MGDKKKEKLSKQVFRYVEKEGTHLSNSAETKGRKRALLIDDKGGMKGPPELVPVEPEIRERTIVKTRIIEKKPSLMERVGQDLAEQVISDLPEVALGVIGLVQEHKAAKEREEQRQYNIRMQQLRIENLEKERELEELRQRQREQEQREKELAAIPQERKQVMSMASVLNTAYDGFVEDMTKDEACKTLISAFIHLIMGIKEIQKLQHARIIDNDSREAIVGTDWLRTLPAGEILQSVNMLLKANPTWLEKYQVVMLSDIFGRDIISEGEYVPITGDELTECFLSVV